MSKGTLHTEEHDTFLNPASETKVQGFSASQIADSRISRNNGNADELARSITHDDDNVVGNNSDDSTLQSCENDNDSDELAQLLKRVDHDNEYVVGRVLKKSDFEETQLVYKCEPNGTKSGPYIRKYLNIEAGVGSAYEKLYNAQQKGQSFSFLPTIYECYFLHNTLIVVMEYVQGETLQEVVYRCDPSVDLAKEVFPRLCSAVRELHEKFNPPLIHRDLKPGNIIMSFNRLTLIDFGIAREYRDDSDNDTVRFGTREYAPPEQFGYGQTDVRSDVYALGMLLYYCLTEETASSKVREADFADYRIPEEYRCTISRACAFDPNDRYDSVATLQNAFEQASNRLTVANKSSSHKAEVSPQKRDVLSMQSNQRPSVHRRSPLANAFTKFFMRVPYGVGIAWNVVLLLLWVLVVVACVSSLVNPADDSLQGFPLWYRAYGNLALVGFSWTSITYVFLDKRLLFRRFPQFCRFSFPLRALIFALCVPLSLFLIFIFLTFILTPPAISWQ